MSTTKADLVALAAALRAAYASDENPTHARVKQRTMAWADRLDQIAAQMPAFSRDEWDELERAVCRSPSFGAKALSKQQILIAKLQAAPDRRME